MALLLRNRRIFTPGGISIRTGYGRTRIGNRDIVGHGMNGSANYRDDPFWPFPAVRFMENCKEVEALRVKEKGDWKMLSCDEKKALYRASFCQTFAEFQHPTGQWKYIFGVVLMLVSIPLWQMIFYHHFGMVGYNELSVRRDLALVTYVHSVLVGRICNPVVLGELRVCVPDGYVGRRRRPPLLLVPRARTNLLAQAPLTRAAHALNLISVHVDLFHVARSEFRRMALLVLCYITEPLPISLCKASQRAQLRRMLELRVNPIDGISSKWDYENDRWK